MSGTSAKLMAGLGLALFLAISPQIRGQLPSSRPAISPNLTLMGFTLEQSTLADVENKLGASSPGSCAKGTEAGKIICYVSTRDNGTRIYFESGFSGAWTRLDGFTVVLGDAARTCRLQCRATAAFGNAVQTSGGLKLGLTQKELEALLGPPTKVDGDRLTFEWQSRRPMTKREVDKAGHTFKDPATTVYWDVLDTIDVVIRGSRVTQFEIHHTVSD
jgi:hypothetical protein